MTVAGIDGGGTKTDCVIIDGEGRCLGFGRGGPSTALHVPADAVRNSIGQAIAEARRTLPEGVVVERVGVVVPPFRLRTFEQAVAEGFPDAQVVRPGDEASACLFAATLGRRGVVVLSGTGSFAASWNGAKRVAFAGAKGPILGDQGSGWWIAVEGLRAVVKALDGRGAETALVEEAFAHFEARDLDGLVDAIYSDASQRHDVGAFCPRVVRAAEDGDGVAQGILDGAVEALGEMAGAVIRRAGWREDEFPLVLAGGVLNGSLLLRRSVESVVQGIAHGARATHARFGPTVGVALEALSDAGVAATADAVALLNETLPEEAKVP